MNWLWQALFLHSSAEMLLLVAATFAASIVLILFH
jgi:hypothetical protein